MNITGITFNSFIDINNTAIPASESVYYISFVNYFIVTLHVIFILDCNLMPR